MISLDSEDLRSIAKWLVAFFAIVVCIKGINFVRRWALLAPTTTTTHQLIAGGRNQILLTGKKLPGGWKGPKMDMYAPYCLDFTSSGQELEVCVVPCNLAYRADKHKELARVADEFAAGRTPEVVVGQAIGVQGRIYLTDPWKRGSLAKYAVFVRSKNLSEVTFVIYHWR